jgi:hypothetical protein
MCEGEGPLVAYQQRFYTNYSRGSQVVLGESMVGQFIQSRSPTSHSPTSHSSPPPISAISLLPRQQHRSLVDVTLVEHSWRKAATAGIRRFARALHLHRWISLTRGDSWIWLRRVKASGRPCGKVCKTIPVEGPSTLPHTVVGLFSLSLITTRRITTRC